MGDTNPQPDSHRWNDLLTLATELKQNQRTKKIRLYARCFKWVVEDRDFKKIKDIANNRLIDVTEDSAVWRRNLQSYYRDRTELDLLLTFINDCCETFNLGINWGWTPYVSADCDAEEFTIWFYDNEGATGEAEGDEHRQADWSL